MDADAIAAGCAAGATGAVVRDDRLRRRGLLRPRVPEDAADECDDERRGDRHPAVDGAAAIAAELPAQARPHFVAVRVAALGDRKLIDEREDAAQRVELRAAFLARGEMLRRERRIAVVVVVRNQLFFCQVLHGVDLTIGSSASRNLRTARKIVCFAALT